MSETLHDHGGHNFQHHGGDAGGASGFGHQHGQQHHGSLSHLLGTDGDHQHGAHGQHAGHHHHHNGEISPNPQGSPSWSSALQGVKLQDMLQGINVTPNTLFLLLFLSMGAWLWVVYFV